MRHSEMKEILKKKTFQNTVLSVFLVFTSLSGMLLFLIGIAKNISLLRQLGIMSFAVYFFAAGGYCQREHRKGAVFLWGLSIVLLLLAISA